MKISFRESDTNSKSNYLIYLYTISGIKNRIYFFECDLNTQHLNLNEINLPFNIS